MIVSKASLHIAKRALNNTSMNSLVEFLKNDFWPGLSNVDRWVALSFRTLRSLNRRAKLGFLWIMLSAGFFVAAVSLVYSLVFSTKLDDLLPYIAVGYITWTLIMGLLVSMPTLFSNYASYITQKNLPLTLYVAANTFDKISVFIAQSVVIFIACLIYNTGASSALFILPLALMIIFVTAVGVSFLVSLIAVRYRDLGQILNSSILLIFLTTPIIWKPEFAGKRALIVELNPFYHFIHIVRAPILDQRIPWNSFLVAASIAIFSLLLGLFAMSRYRHRVIYWI